MEFNHRSKNVNLGERIIIKNRRKMAVSLILTGALSLTLMGTAVFANTTSPPYNVVVYGNNFNFTSQVWVRGSGSSATVEAVNDISADTTVAAGWMGGQARLYNSAGTLIVSSPMTYNSSNVASMWIYSPTIKTAGKYYAQSLGSFKTPTKYENYGGYKSEVQTFPVSTLSKSSNETSEEIKKLMSLNTYPVNRNGETFGSGLSIEAVGYEPDLVSAIGTNGVEGYVRADDLVPKVSTVEEAIEVTGENDDIRTIPLYDADGETVLGDFELVTKYTYEEPSN